MSATDQATHAEPDEYVAPAEMSTCRHCGWSLYRYSAPPSPWRHQVNDARACPAERLVTALPTTPYPPTI